jgi:phosphoenolpyruvate-protein kinase (PTS system EI component)
LFRTEFLAISAEPIPGEEEQYGVYKQMMGRIEGRRVVFHTFDLGGDKYLPVLEQCAGRNPALGMRGIRYHLFIHPEEFRVKLKALLRTVEGTVIDILIPLVIKVDKVVRVKAQLDIARKELLRRGKPIAKRLRPGVMIEVSAAAFSVEELLSKADFLRVGTNDLLKCFMAAITKLS